MHIKEGQNRDDLVMFSYDQQVAQDNPVRLIDLICSKFISDNPWRKTWKGNKAKGCKSYPPKEMLSLLVYGYFNQINSSRRLEKETYRNIEMIWLMNGLQPDHWTICAFRRENKDLVKDLLKKFRSFLLDNEYASSKRIVFDGTKLKAYASRDMMNKESIDKKLKNIDESIAKYLLKLENTDIQDDELEMAQKEILKLKEKIEKLESEKKQTEKIKKELESSGKNQIAPNDKDAVLVKGRDGKFAGYNGQSGVDSKGHFIMHNEITTDTNDLQQLENCVTNAQEEMGQKIEEAVADKGYANMIQILNIENEDIECFIPLSNSLREQEKEKGLIFEYNKDSDNYTCVQGKTLVLLCKNCKEGRTVYKSYKCYDCEGCPIRETCTKSKTGRIYKRNLREEDIEKYKEKLGTRYAKARIAERKCVVEHPFGTMKWMMGKFNFLLTGKDKVQAEFDLYSTAYNIKRLINCGDFSFLTKKIRNYQWSLE